MVSDKELTGADAAFRKEFAALVRTKARARVMTMYQLAKETGTNYRTIQNMMDCKDCKRSTMIKVARVLEIDIVMI